MGLVNKGPLDERWITLGDMDGDHDLDLVAGEVGRGTLLFNDGAGRFTIGGNYQLGITGGFVALGDLDGDGDLDLAAGNFLFINDGAGNFGSPRDLGAVPALFPTSFADMDGDGDLDLVSAGIAVLYNDGTGGSIFVLFVGRSV